eukprot:CAMPEP_0201662456 /NCGR_PEP_ID=MMETSP0494-20130426/4532_1 /ASSEMBLY_ACC=CAM_ASM_000839 /TAXON_ID=420259 /ORGANISM="Thalassiosira gravida, Strain GMp14c1" /LENGTH=1029 /DNA_ID=CAMNT_0048140817 /DNA_START=180 /DNA_END=3269 /DNA_ORIENTATION=+
MGASASKIKFRESLTSLTTRDVSPTDTDFWDELWKIPSSSEEVFELLTPANARKLRDDRFENLATLFTQATAQLCQIVETPYTIYFDQALNCVRVLTRVVPFLLEKGDLGEGDKNVEVLCWGPQEESYGNGDGATVVTGGGETRMTMGGETATTTTTTTTTTTSAWERKKRKQANNKGANNKDKEEDDEEEIENGSMPMVDSTEDSLGMEVKLDQFNKDKKEPKSTPKTSLRRGRPKKQEESSSESDEDEDDDEDGSSETESEKNSVEEESDNDATREDAGEEDEEEEEEEEDNEPLALLVVHAAMHMLFLPQFTCEFYEEESDPPDYLSDDDSLLSDDGNNANANANPSDSDGEDEAGRDRRLDRDARADAGLGRPRRVARGMPLAPRPAGIVWAPGVGFAPDGRCLAGINRRYASAEANAKFGSRAAAARAAARAARATPRKVNPEAAYTRKYDKNRIEVLRLLLAACSDPLFSPADEYNPLASRWMSVAVAADAPNAPCLFYSLLNTVISYDPHYGNFGNFAGGVPYGGNFSSDAHVKLVELSAQVLCVLLDCGLSGDPRPYEDRHGEPVVGMEESYEVGFNIFRVLLARINNGKDLEALYRGFVRLLRNMHESKNTLLSMPNSPTRLECHQELLILLWKTLEENPLFLDFILTRCDVCELVTPICYLMYVSRKDAAQVGLIHICTFILLKLSGERSFGVSLNRPYRTKLPCDLPLFSGSHADLISITLHKIIVNGSYRLVPLYSCFLTIVCNISPYWRSMSLVASVKLVNLFELFSSPKFLYSSEKSYRHLALLLEIFNNIIQYQYNGNQHLVYAIVRRKDSFGRLASLTLAKAIYQCNKAFPKSDEPEYDADAEEAAAQVAAMTVQDVDEGGKPLAAKKGKGFNGAAKADGAEPPPRKKPPRGRFLPNEAWMGEIKRSLPLETCNRLLQHLVPVVDDMCRRKNGVVDEIEILEVFKDITMVGLLPVPHAIVIRKYQPNQYTSIWFTAFMWGVIFLRSQKPPIFDKECIELFQVSNEDESAGGGK